MRSTAAAARATASRLIRAAPCNQNSVAMELLTHLARRARRLAARVMQPSAPRPHGNIFKASEAVELGGVAATLAKLGGTGYQSTFRRLRELYDLATPSIYLQVATAGQPCRIVLVPWERGQIAFSGRGFHLMAGAEATSGLEAFLLPREVRTPALYSTAPDHPLFAVALSQPGIREFRGYFPPYVTHLTIVADGREIVLNCPLAHDQGACVFRVHGGRAA